MTDKRLNAKDLCLFFSMITFLQNRKRIFILAGCGLACLVLIFFIVQQRKNASGSGQSEDRAYPELAYLAGTTLSFGELSHFFRGLAEEKGAAYAFEVLKAAPLPPGTDLHLLGHAVGDVLYKQQGMEGIKICTNDFRNACSHSIVVGLLLDHGEQVLPKIASACRQAPGGSGAYTMCYHGLGHGVLAYVNYDLARAVALCKKTGSAAYHNEEASQCVGGTIMEIISGGGHNHDVWEKQRPRWLKPDDPLYPCKQNFMPDSAKTFCYLYITPYLFEAAGADPSAPDSAALEKAFQFCDALPKNDPGDRGSCYGGFGKDLIVLAQGRDIRKMTEMTYPQFERVYTWCLLARD